MLTHVAQRLFNTPLLAHKPYAEAIATVLAPRLGVQPILSAEQLPKERAVRLPRLYESGVMVIPVVGGLVHRGDSFDAASGTESYTHLNDAIVSALKNEKCRAILLDVDSPGGEAGGCFELADTILDARKIKPVWAVANTLACSAAYAILASATRCFMTPMGAVGSIGVVWMHVDMSKAMQQAGIVTSFVFAGAHKIDGNPFEPLSKEDRANFQQSVDYSYGLFVDAIAKRRPIKADAIRATEARVYRADEAKGLKLVDGISSYQACLAELEDAVSPHGPRTVISTSAEQEQDDMTTFTQEQHNAALASARAEALADGKKQGHAEGYAQGRADAGKIVTSEKAKGKPAMAAQLAADAAMTPEKADSYLAAAGAEAEDKPTPVLNGLVPNPKVSAGGGTDNEDAGDVQAKRVAELTALGKQVSARPATR
jgi:signal peptide peptidase SppA